MSSASSPIRCAECVAKRAAEVTGAARPAATVDELREVEERAKPLIIRLATAAAQCCDDVLEATAAAVELSL
jgi:hypothetical protein